MTTPNLVGPPLVAVFPPPPNLWGCHLGVCGHPKSFGATIGHCVVLSSPQTMGYGCGSAAIPNLLGPLVAGFPLPQSMGPSLGGLQPPHIFWGHRWALCCRSPPNLWGCQLGVCGHPKSCGATIGCWVIHPPPNLWGHHLRSAVTTWAHPDLGSHQYRSPLQLLNTNIGSPPLLWFPPSPPPPNSVPSNIEPPSPPHFMVPTNIGPPCNR